MMQDKRKEGLVPVTTRIHVLDFIRGVAILAMLIANVPWHVGSSMSRVHEADVSSVGAWLLQYLLVDQRFMPLFCMLFGAGLLLLNKSTHLSGSFRTYYLWRMALLLLIGIAHVYLLWPGDILMTYALCGPVLLVFFNKSVRTLLTVGLICKAVDLAFGEWPFLYTNTLRWVLFSWWVDYGDAPSTALQAYQGSYLDLMRYNAWRAQFLQWTAFPYFRMWNALGFMLIGMALFKNGVLQGQKSPAFYRKMMGITCFIGSPLVLYGVLARIGANSTVGPYLGFTHELPLRNITFRTGCAVLSFAVLGGLHLIYPYLAKPVTIAVEAVGRMGLTNYLFHSLFFIILVHSLAWVTFDSLDHDAMLGWVVVVWVIQVSLSLFWLRHFKQGPIEALWRKVSRLAKQRVKQGSKTVV